MANIYFADFDQVDEIEESSQVSQNLSSLTNPQNNFRKEKIVENHKKKFQAGKIEGNLFKGQSYENQYHLQQEQKNIENPDSSKDKNKKRQQHRITPLKDQQSEQLYINLNYSTVKINEQLIEEQPKRTRRKKKIEKVQQSQQINQEEISHISLKQQNEQENKNFDKSISKINNQQLLIPQQSKQPMIEIKKQQNELQYLQSNNKEPGTQEKNQIILNKIKQMISREVPKDKCLKLVVIRESGIFTIYPIYKVHFSSNNQFMMCAKKTSNTVSPTFIISSNLQNIQENGPNYLGKLKLSFLGNICSIFGPGLNPQNAFKQKVKSRQLLATIVYLNDFFSVGSKPRQIRVYLKKPQYSYHSLYGVQMYKQQKSLEELYNYQQNKDKILVFNNRAPVWKEQLKGYSLNFRGRVSTASIKNFILEGSEKNDLQENDEVLLFGKAQDNQFNMDVSYPLNPMIAFGISLTSFGPA